ncbi:hypothetical protein [Pedobacter gandavensis]|uniref:DUF4251 domain-containing protein n=1 Tax=Pedobacter gandavensis TaxID=2679963 RepID=A0ABR6EVZ1_9SPHI|nr:hypothetical protein [Pedobacter gandavensis]MBB2149187.1 hypothetical protein [Pedobacter gandavensis]
MKKLHVLIAAAALLMSSCSPIIRTPEEFSSGITDYSTFAKKGFFITESNSVNFDYQPIGSVYVKQQAGYEVLSNTTKQKVYSDDVIGGKSTEDFNTLKIGSKFIPLDINRGLKEIHFQSEKSGANGIINLKITHWNGGYSITGMAIKK